MQRNHSMYSTSYFTHNWPKVVFDLRLLYGDLKLRRRPQNLAEVPRAAGRCVRLHETTRRHIALACWTTHNLLISPCLRKQYGRIPGIYLCRCVKYDTVCCLHEYGERQLCVSTGRSIFVAAKTCIAGSCGCEPASLVQPISVLTVPCLTVVQLRKYKLCTVLPIWRTPRPISDFCEGFHGFWGSFYM